MPRGRPPSTPVHIEGVPYWRCSSCLDYRPAKRFARHNAAANGLQSWCRMCKRRRVGRTTLRSELRAALVRLEKRVEG